LACNFIAARLRLINQQVKEAERRLDELCAEIEASTPGQICEQRDIAIPAFLSRAQKDQHRRAVRRRPPQRQELCCVRRYACNHRLQNAVCHWSRVAIQHDPSSKARS
jgi:hypothetical protein